MAMAVPAKHLQTPSSRLQRGQTGHRATSSWDYILSHVDALKQVLICRADLQGFCKAHNVFLRCGCSLTVTLTGKGSTDGSTDPVGSICM